MQFILHRMAYSLSVNVSCQPHLVRPASQSRVPARRIYLTQMSGEVLEVASPDTSIVALHSLECAQFLMLLKVGLFEPSLPAAVCLVAADPDIRQMLQGKETLHPSSHVDY
jgi:hypothetical protein